MKKRLLNKPINYVFKMVKIEKKKETKLLFFLGQSFSHRLTSDPPRVSFNTNIFLSKDDLGTYFHYLSIEL